MNCVSNDWAQQPDKNSEKDPFVLVVNEGSAEFAHLDLGTHARRIDFRKVAEAVIGKAKTEDHLCGNFSSISCLVVVRIKVVLLVVEIADYYS